MSFVTVDEVAVLVEFADCEERTRGVEEYPTPRLQEELDGASVLQRVGRRRGGGKR